METTGKVPLTEAARGAGISRRTAYRLAAVGLLTLYKQAGKNETLVDPAELAAALRPRPKVRA